MCGIIGILTPDKVNIFDDLLKSLLQLQNRGYDAAGVGYISDGVLKHTKFGSTSSVSCMTELEQQDIRIHHIGIGHTRWATHGRKVDVNSHPHISSDECCMIVHNGMINNYLSLRESLSKKGFLFVSETDSEVIANCIACVRAENPTMTLKWVVSKALSFLEGTWGLVIVFREDPKTMFCARRGSPLLVSAHENLFMVVSEVSAFCQKVTSFRILEDNELCIASLNNRNILIMDIGRSPERTLQYVEKMSLPSDFQHWTQKEINEQPISIRRALEGRLSENGKVQLGGLDPYRDLLSKLNHVVLIGCGTSYFAGEIGLEYLKRSNIFCTVQIFDAGEFSTKDLPRTGITGVIFLSQSGETRDVFKCIQMCKGKVCITIGIVNVVDSIIALEVDCGCYLNAGREVGVASTKSFTSQVFVLILLAFWFKQLNKHIISDIEISHLRSIPFQIQKL